MGGALEARKIDASHGKLSSEVTGEVEIEDGVLVLKRIHVVYHLKGAAGQEETVRRVHSIHQKRCPIYRSIYRAIDITTEMRLS